MSYCSLIIKTPQIILPGVYTALRFDTESSDHDGWHPSCNLNSKNSALIIPKLTAVGALYAEIFWENPKDLETPPTQYQSHFSRDPFDADIDNTCTEDRAPTPGAQFITKSWAITVRKGQPLAVRVAHNGSGPLAVTLAEFKVWVPVE